jgi:hypothetical protein
MKCGGELVKAGSRGNLSRKSGASVVDVFELYVNMCIEFSAGVE